MEHSNYARDRYLREQAERPRVSHFIDWQGVEAAFKAGEDRQIILTRFGVTDSALRTAVYKGRVKAPLLKRGRPPKAPAQ